jgi:hypothetical protein
MTSADTVTRARLAMVNNATSQVYQAVSAKQFDIPQYIEAAGFFNKRDAQHLVSLQERFGFLFTGVFACALFDNRLISSVNTMEILVAHTKVHALLHFLETHQYVRRSDNIVYL